MMSPAPPTSIANRQDPSDLAISPKHQLTTQIFGNFAPRPMDWCHCSPTTTDRKNFLWTRDLWTTQIIWSVLLFPHRTKQSRAAICPCLAFSAQLDLSFGRLWNLDVEWNRHDCDPATFDLMTWRLWSWSTWNYAPRRFQILNMVLESDVENSAWNRSLGGAWLWGRGLEFEPPPCSGHPALGCIYHLALYAYQLLRHIKSGLSFEINLRQHSIQNNLFRILMKWRTETSARCPQNVTIVGLPLDIIPRHDQRWPSI